MAHRRAGESKTVAEFFAGIGLMRAGLEKSGWTVSLANDIDSTKMSIYLNHFVNASDHFILEDIHKLSANTIPKIDLATASFPCTDLSLAGRRAGLQGQQSSAFWGFVNILKGMGEKKPSLILLENVVGFLTSNNGKDFRNALIALNEQGYSVDAFVINAAHFVPQSRVRLFVVGTLTNAVPAPFKSVAESELRPSKLVSFINDNRDIAWHLNNDLPKLPTLQDGLEKIVESIPKSSKLWWSKDRVDYLLNQTFERHLTKVNELKNKKKITYLTAFRRVRDGKSMAEIRFDGIAGCLRTPKGGSARQILLEVGKGAINIRLLTPKECAALMGVGDFNLSCSANEALFGFGDAVCVPVVSWIADNYLNPVLTTLRNVKKIKSKHYAAITA